MKFKTGAGQVVALPNISGKETEKQLMVMGLMHEQEEELIAYIEKEVEGKVVEEVVDKIKLIGYDALPKKLVVVPVNMSSKPIEQPMLESKLNDIFKGAAVKWQTEVKEPVTLEGWDVTTQDGKLDDGATGMLSAYTKEMNRLIKAYEKKAGGLDKEAFYIFLLNESASGLKGYMPRKRSYGFAFTGVHTSEQSLIKTVGHELSHGAFRLEHTFKTYPSLAEGTTDNLLDNQAEGKTLHKYQWDLIHDPVAVIGILEEDEDAFM